MKGKWFLFIAIFIATLAVHFSANASVFEEKPNSFHPKFEAAGCFIEYQDKILILHRQDTARQGNTWAVPGGKLEKGETPEEAVVREVSEETGLNISKEPVQYLKKFYIKYPEYDYIFHILKVRISDSPESIKLSSREHKGYTWVSFDDALKMQLMPNEDVIFKAVEKNLT